MVQRVVRFTDKRGFTLIEILIVIAILGILAVSLLGNYISSAKKGRDAQRKSDLGQLQKALEMYYSDMGSYPIGTSGQIMGCPSGTACVWGATGDTGHLRSAATGGTTYMRVIPKDPGTYTYCYISDDGTYFKIYAKFENTSDLKATLAVSCNGTTYNYGVASTNEIP